ncbi:8764_t:CDS:2, partial [Entrophospora sp. SA101]
IDAFDQFQEHGTEIPTLNILNAINWTAESWKNVTMIARDYIEIDNNLRTGEMLSDDEIIAA